MAQHFLNSKPNLGRELTRLASFGANLADAHSCFLFLPTSVARIFGSELTGDLAPSNHELLHLVGAHSLCNAVVSHCVLPIESGLIGWVAKHGRSIHVSPFEHDSRTLGIYHTDQSLKSFIGVPLSLEEHIAPGSCCGVIACDSKKAFAFSKLQGKLLEELSAHVGSLLRLAVSERSYAANDFSWDTFVSAGELTARTLGLSSVAVLRLVPNNFYQIEKALGIKAALNLMNQVIRLIQQALPPGTPLCRLPNGEILIALDNMLVSFYQSRIEAVAAHAAENAHHYTFDFRMSGKSRRGEAATFTALVAETAGEPAQPVSSTSTAMETSRYEYRRA